VKEDWILRERKPRSGAPTKIDGKIKAKIPCLLVQASRRQIKMDSQSLADKLVEMEVVNSISNMTVQRVLKKNELKPCVTGGLKTAHSAG